MKKKNLLISLCLLTGGIVSLASVSALNYQPEKVAVVKRAVDTSESSLNNYFSSNEDLPSEFGNKVGGIITIDGTYYQNYTMGYCSLTINPNGRSYTIKNHAGRQIDADGNLKVLPLADLLNYVADSFATSGNDDFSRPLNDAETVKPLIVERMKAVYTEFYNKGIILGIGSSDVKCWDGYIVQDFSWGDGTFSFGGNRYGMSFIFFNYRLTDNETEGQAFVVNNAEAKYWDENKNNLGYPTSNKMTDSITLPGTTEPQQVTFQTFESGFLVDEDGTLTYRSGFVYDPVNKNFIAKATPYVDSRYGSFVNEYASEDNSRIVKVYAHGSIVCTLVKGEYLYDYEPARIYKNLNEYEMDDFNYYLNDVAGSFEITLENESKVARKFKNKYKNLLNNNFFVGFKESNVSGNWNGVIAQQFILGDSTANPWEGTRTNVAALVYNQSADEVFLLANNSMMMWNKSGNYSNYGSPLSDEYVVGKDVFQDFEGGLLVILNNNTDTAFLYKGTYDEYVTGKANYEKPSFGSEYTKTTTVTNFTPLYAIAFAVPAVIVAGGIFLIVALDKKKKAKKKESE